MCDTIRALVISTTGAVSETELDPNCTLTELQARVGGLVTAVALPSPTPGREITAWLGDEAAFTETINTVASDVISAHTGYDAHYFGTAVFTSTDDQGATASLTPAEADSLASTVLACGA